MKSRRRATIIRLAGAGLALCGFTLAFLIGTGHSVDQSNANVVVLKKDVTTSDQLTADSVTVVSAPASVIPTGALSDPSGVINKWVRTNLSKNSIVTQQILTTNQPQISAGNVMVSVPWGTPKTSGIDALKPNDHVDIICNLTDQGGTSFAFQDVRVISITPNVGMQLEVPRDKAPALSLLVSGQGGSIVNYALRAPGQNNQGALPPTAPVTPSDLVGILPKVSSA
jgi:Flp pilus assembly protein CpaB